MIFSSAGRAWRRGRAGAGGTESWTSEYCSLCIPDRGAVQCPVPEWWASLLFSCVCLGRERGGRSCWASRTARWKGKLSAPKRCTALGIDLRFLFVMNFNISVRSDLGFYAHSTEHYIVVYWWLNAAQTIMFGFKLKLQSHGKANEPNLHLRFGVVFDAAYSYFPLPNLETVNINLWFGKQSEIYSRFT